MRRQKYKSYMITWHIGIRRKESGLLNKLGQFMIIKNPSCGWLADPFIVEENGNVYIFAELYLYKAQKGCIACAEWRDGLKKLQWKVILNENTHMSYPFIWKQHGEYFMCPETNEKKAVCVYKCIDFPYVWKFEKIITSGISFADSTIYFSENGNPRFIDLFSVDKIAKGRLFRCQINEDFEISKIMHFVTKDSQISRPGGKYIQIGKDIYRVAQDCSKSYGEKVIFLKGKTDFINGEIIEEIVEERKYNELSVDEKMRCIGVHTYNSSVNYEVVDFREYKFSVINFWHTNTKKIKRILNETFL